MTRKGCASKNNMDPIKRENIDINTVENPNVSVSWDADAFDRMEGSIQSKNKNSMFGSKKEYIDPTKR